MRKNRSAKWNVAKRMPPLRHSLPGQKFDWMNSEVCEWLTRQPEIRALIFDAVKQHGEITFDPKAGTWKGVDYER